MWLHFRYIKYDRSIDSLDLREKVFINAQQLAIKWLCPSVYLLYFLYPKFNQSWYDKLNNNVIWWIKIFPPTTYEKQKDTENRLLSKVIGICHFTGQMARGLIK